MNSDDEGAAVGADGGVDDGQMNGGWGEGGEGALEGYGAFDDVAGGNGVGDVHQARGRGVAQQNSFHGRDVPVVEAEVCREAYNRDWQGCDRRIQHKRPDRGVVAMGQTMSSLPA